MSVLGRYTHKRTIENSDRIRDRTATARALLTSVDNLARAQSAQPCKCRRVHALYTISTGEVYADRFGRRRIGTILTHCSAGEHAVPAAAGLDDRLLEQAARKRPGEERVY